MPKITFIPSNKTIEAATGSDLLDAARKAGLTVEVPCGGKGVCGRCLVQVSAGSVEFADNGVLPRDLLDDGYVLICRAKVAGDATVRTGAELAQEQGQFSNAAEDRRRVDSTLLPGPADLDPLVRAAALRVAPGVAGDGLSDLDRLNRAATATLGSPLQVPLAALRRLPEELRAREGRVEVLYWRDGDALRAVDVRADGAKHYGIAVDIGTTTVAVQLVDLTTGAVLGERTDYNGQIAGGLDVISRINYARRPERLQELREKVLGTINGLIAGLCQQAQVPSGAVVAASMAGNTTMTHLLLGIVPEYIRLDPYVSAVFTPPVYTAAEVGLHIHAQAPVRLAPAVGSYVGGDITSGLLCTPLSEETGEACCLFIDIGTNGEIVLGNGDFLLGCACSAGPAFEGGGIDCGMRASAGAIEWVDVDVATGLPSISVIGGGAPRGICGSGMISLIASLFETGWLDAAGRLDRSRPCAVIEDGKVARYRLCEAHASATGQALYISETDVDNVIRAKGAIFSACQVLLGKVGLEFTDLSRILIAGGFGRYLDVGRSVTIGLLPDVPQDKLHFVGNTSLLGAYCTLVSDKHRTREAATASRITYLDLSVEPEYMDAYTGALFLPHTDERLFPSVRRR